MKERSVSPDTMGDGFTMLNSEERNHSVLVPNLKSNQVTSEGDAITEHVWTLLQCNKKKAVFTTKETVNIKHT